MSVSPTISTKGATGQIAASCATPQAQLIINGKVVPTGPRADRVASMDDPFVTPTRGIETVSPSAACESATVDSRELQVNITPTPTGFTPRADRLAEVVSADNAQAVYPPQACIFVAK